MISIRPSDSNNLVRFLAFLIKTQDIGKAGATTPFHADTEELMLVESLVHPSAA